MTKHGVKWWFDWWCPESEKDDGEALICRRPPWRAEGVNDFFDDIVKAKKSSQARHQKKRVLSETSSCHIPVCQNE